MSAIADAVRWAEEIMKESHKRVIGIMASILAAKVNDATSSLRILRLDTNRWHRETN